MSHGNRKKNIMKKCSFDIWYFLGIDKKGNTDGNSMTTQQRVDEALLLLVDKSDYIELTLTDGKTKTKCYSAEDITKIIAEYNSEHAHGGE